jgi:predicted Zn-dependent peptidase
MRPLRLVGLAGWLVAALLVLSPARAMSADPVSGFRAPSPVLRTLPNGLTVAVFEDDRLPLVQLQLLVAAGSAHEPPGEAGVATLTFQMLAQGTASRTGAAFEEGVQALGGSIGGNVARGFATINGAFLTGDMEAGLELLADVIVNPILDEAQIPAVKGRIAGGIASARRDPVTLADDHLWAAVFGDHPYGRPAYGGLRSLAGLSAAQVRMFHRSRYRPDQALLAIAGDITPERAFKAAEELLGSWGGRVKDASPAPLPAPPADFRVRIVDAPGQTRAELRLGTVGPSGSDADHEALAVAGELLASGAEPALRFGLLGLRSAGLFSLASSSSPDSAGREVARMRAALAGGLAAAPAAGALDEVKRRMAARFAFQFETRAGVIAQWMASTISGVDGDRMATYPLRVAALTGDDVRAALARHVAPDRMVLVAVGPADRLRSQLEGLGPVEVIPAEAAAEVVEVPSSARGPARPEQVAKGRALAAQAVAAHGGLEKLRLIKDSTLEGDAIVTPGAHEQAGKVLQVRKDPDHFLFSLSISMLKSTQVLDGDRGWTQSGDQASPIQDLDSLGVAGLRSGNHSDLCHLLLAAADPASMVAWRGRERRDERDTDVLEVVSADGERRVLFLELESHRLVAMEQADGGHSTRRIYRDLRPVNGVLWPFGEERLVDGQRTMSFALSRVAFNTGVKDAVFQRPGSKSATPAAAPKPRAR